MSDGSVAMAAGSAAFLLAPAFTSGPAARDIVPERSLSTPAPQIQASSGIGRSAVGISAVSALALGAAVGRKRATARATVLTKDDAGRFRFEVPAVPLVPKEQPGVTAPLGFFDPAGFAEGGLMTFKGDETGFKHLRAAEIKHGRVAMMAALGNVAAYYWKLPGFEEVPTGLAAFGTEQGVKGFAALFCLVGLKEASDWKPSKDEPGSYGDPFNFGQYTPEMRTKELNNGRMAMFAVMGQLVAEMATGLDPVKQFGI
mmetsp:Transcript_16739/g.24997  ORF Transcript_16739/g.24997 Transcript_16739/m.24997 type:complete len:257 (+) Transcript_16739:62-832(+)